MAGRDLTGYKVANGKDVVSAHRQHSRDITTSGHTSPQQHWVPPSVPCTGRRQILYRSWNFLLMSTVLIIPVTPPGKQLFIFREGKRKAGTCAVLATSFELEKKIPFVCFWTSALKILRHCRSRGRTIFVLLFLLISFFFKATL